MMRASIFIFALAVAVGGSAIHAAPYVQPCQSWTYSSDVRGYVCSYHSFSTKYVEEYDFFDALDRIDRLEKQVKDLEARVSKLENPPTPNP